LQSPVRKTIVLAASVAAVLGGSAIALASAAGPGATSTKIITACTKNGVPEHFYTGTSEHGCPKGQARVPWNQKGPQGATGETGATGPAGPQGPAATNDVFTEVDNGTEFAVSASPAVADTSKAGATYADAGVAVNVGTVADLSASKLAFTGSQGLVENLWIGNGAEASTPGIYSLSSGADFCYGDGQPSGSFYMQGNCGSSLDGQTLTLAQIQSDFPGQLQAYAWVGVTSSGKAVTPTQISTVDGQSIHLWAAVLANSDGSLTPYVN
jgi:hypothetical protein